jgi:hypothetical protein
MDKDLVGKIVAAVLVVVLGGVSGRVVHHASQVTAGLEDAHERIEELSQRSNPELAEANRLLQKEIEMLGEELEILKSEIETQKNFSAQAAAAINELLGNKQKPEEVTP